MTATVLVRRACRLSDHIALGGVACSPLDGTAWRELCAMGGDLVYAGYPGVRGVRSTRDSHRLIARCWVGGWMSAFLGLSTCTAV